MNKNCVAYMRYSSNNQTYMSIEHQRRTINAYCQREGLNLVYEYVDEAQSARTDRRVAFQKMIYAAKHKPSWNMVLVYDNSRAFRNISDANKYTGLLMDYGIRIVNVQRPGDDTPESKMITNIEHVYNEYFSNKLAVDTHKGMEEKALLAGHCGGVPPLGYDIDNNDRLVINETEAYIVREIFRLYSLGYSYKKMAEYFNKLGVRTKLGNPFTKNSFNNILTQKKYIGTYYWNQRKPRDSRGQHNNHSRRSIEHQIVIPYGCPQIIDEQLFENVQRRLAERAHGRADTKSRHHYMLGGMKLLRCASCGSYMTGKVTKSHGKEYIMYSCPNHKGGACPVKDIQAKQLNKYVAKIIVNHFVTKGKLQESANKKSSPKS